MSKVAPSLIPVSAAYGKAAKVRVLNDRFRRSFVGGQIVETSGVVSLAEADRINLIMAVRHFDEFDTDSDPYIEHDFGVLEVRGEVFYWKIDNYDATLSGSSPDPTDPAVTVRVLTIMRADEY